MPWRCCWTRTWRPRGAPSSQPWVCWSRWRAEACGSWDRRMTWTGSPASWRGCPSLFTSSGPRRCAPRWRLARARSWRWPGDGRGTDAVLAVVRALTSTELSHLRLVSAARHGAPAALTGARGVDEEQGTAVLRAVADALREGPPQQLRGVARHRRELSPHARARPQDSARSQLRRRGRLGGPAVEDGAVPGGEALAPRSRQGKPVDGLAQLARLR